MKTLLTLGTVLATLLLGACASQHGGSHSEAYGEIKTGYETSRTQLIPKPLKLEKAAGMCFSFAEASLSGSLLNGFIPILKNKLFSNSSK
jgi:hypothetical protein